MYNFLYLLMLFLVSCAVQEPVASLAKAETGIRYGKGMKIYQQACAACHGSDGTGAFAGVPDLTQVAGFRSKSDSDAELFRHIEPIEKGIKTPGSPISMPAKGGVSDLTEQDIKEVLLYMRDNFTKN